MVLKCVHVYLYACVWVRSVCPVLCVQCCAVWKSLNWVISFRSLGNRNRLRYTEDR